MHPLEGPFKPTGNIMKPYTLLRPLSLLLSGCLLVACNSTLPPGEYNTDEIGKVKKVIPGVIISKRVVNLHNQASEDTRPITKSDDIVGDTYSQTRGVEYVIKLHSGSIISVVQNEDLKLKAKQKILVIYGRHTRVVADKGSDN
jgi:outer membrane lipoprotein SlyB